MPSDNQLLDILLRLYIEEAEKTKSIINSTVLQLEKIVQGIKNEELVKSITNMDNVVPLLHEHISFLTKFNIIQAYFESGEDPDQLQEITQSFENQICKISSKKSLRFFNELFDHTAYSSSISNETCTISGNEESKLNNFSNRNGPEPVKYKNTNFTNNILTSDISVDDNLPEPSATVVRNGFEGACFDVNGVENYPAERHTNISTIKEVTSDFSDKLVSSGTNLCDIVIPNSKIEECTEFASMVLEVHDTGHFYVVSDSYNENEHLNMMKTQYGNEGVVQYLNKDCAKKVLQSKFCVVRDIGSWSRAEIIDWNPELKSGSQDLDLERKVQVMLCDIGATIYVDYNSLHKIKPKVAACPRAAVRCHLHNVKPSPDAKTREVANQIMKDCIGKDCQVFVHTIVGESLGVYLAFDDYVNNINNALIKSQLVTAQDCDDSKKTISDQGSATTPHKSQATSANVDLPKAEETLKVPITSKLLRQIDLRIPAITGTDTNNKQGFTLNSLEENFEHMSITEPSPVTKPHYPNRWREINTVVSLNPYESTANDKAVRNVMRQIMPSMNTIPVSREVNSFRVVKKGVGFGTHMSTPRSTDPCLKEGTDVDDVKEIKLNNTFAETLTVDSIFMRQIPRNKINENGNAAIRKELSENDNKHDATKGTKETPSGQSASVMVPRNVFLRNTNSQPTSSKPANACALSKSEIKGLESIDMSKEALTDACQAVMGYTPTDEARICNFYDPRTGKCFKGEMCKKEHVPINKDGWTTDRVAAKVWVFPKIIIPELNTVLRVKVTYVNKWDSFFGHVVSPPQLHRGMPPPDRLEGMSMLLYRNATELIQHMNSPHFKRRLEPLKFSPALSELVVALYPDDNKYYRGRVTHLKGNGMVDVLYIDYGNTCEVHESTLREFSSDLEDLPYQALEFKIFGLPPSDLVRPEKRNNIRLALSKHILNQAVKCTVKSVQLNTIIAKVLDNHDVDLVEVMKPMHGMTDYELNQQETTTQTDQVPSVKTPPKKTTNFIAG